MITNEQTAAREDSALVPHSSPARSVLVSVLYSAHRDLYQVPAMNKDWWLSVQLYSLPAPALPGDEIYLPAAITADGKGWRKAYSKSWSVIQPGIFATMPADDPMVLDYAAVNLA